MAAGDGSLHTSVTLLGTLFRSWVLVLLSLIQLRASIPPATRKPAPATIAEYPSTLVMGNDDFVSSGSAAAGLVGVNVNVKPCSDPLARSVVCPGASKPATRTDTECDPAGSSNRAVPSSSAPFSTPPTPTTPARLPARATRAPPGPPP